MMIRNYKRKKFGVSLLCIMHCALCIIFAGCAEEVTTDGGVRQAVTFEAILSSDTRAPFDGTWDGGEEIGVQVGSGEEWGTTRKYVIKNTNSSTLVPADGVEPYYLDEVQGKSLRAWYPYSDSYPDNTSMPEIQSDPEVYKNCDILEASDEITSANVPLLFRHSMARLNIKFRNVIAPTEVKVQWGDKLITPYHDEANDCYLAHLIGIQAGNVSVKAVHRGDTYTYVVNQALDGGKEYPIELTLGDYDYLDGVFHVYNANGLYVWAEEAEKDATVDPELGIKQATISCTLEADITLPDVAEGESNWKALGFYPSIQDMVIFAGTFDGNGHTISNLKVSGPSVQGFIGMLIGTVKNLTLKNPQITATSGDYAGAVAATSNGEKIYGCQVIGGSVTGFENVGGIVGNAEGSSEIYACSATCDVSGYNAVGGIAGWLEGNISSCWANCNVSATADPEEEDEIKVGAFAGRYNGIPDIYQCYYVDNNGIGVGEGEYNDNATQMTDNTTWSFAAARMNDVLGNMVGTGYECDYIWAENPDAATKAQVPLVLVKKE